MDGFNTGDRYDYKGKAYEIVGFDGLKMKDPNDGNWSAAVAYRLVDDHDAGLFVRGKADFLAKFKPAE